MAFSYTNMAKDAMGRGVTMGTYTNTAGSTGGDINTGLRSIDIMLLQPLDTAISANQPVVNETLPLASGTATIVTSADEVGVWIAFGR